MLTDFMAKKYNFPVATHSYFRALNIKEERAKFLASSDYLPKFDYPKRLSLDRISCNIEKVVGDSTESQSLECALIAANLQIDERYLLQFRKINEKLFGLPDKSHAENILSRMMSSDASKPSLYRSEVMAILGDIQKPHYQLGPDKETFSTYREYFIAYRKDSDKKDRNIFNAIKSGLINSGLSQKGWDIELVDGDSHARTCHHSKRIKIGKDYNPRKLMAFDRIVAHEVYGHALRGPQGSLAESEGFALVLEQLTGSKFKFRRAYRYLAASLGWGVFGHSMNFRDVFEIIWRLMIISSGYSKQQSKEHAFGECYRVFRGGRPDVAGAVYLKDIIYFESNLKVWEFLTKNRLTYSEFVDIIEGRSTIAL